MTEEEFRTGNGVEHHFDYMAEADRTNSVLFNPQNIDRDAFVRNLKAFVETANVLNLYKKLLFRGKTPEELGLPKPLLHASLAVEFDPNNSSETTINVVHGAIGVMTEAGEVAELILNAIENAERDDVNVLEECGDIMWYLARMLRGVGSNFDHCGRTNINKLRGRHGATFNVERDHNRNLEDERMQLERDASTPLFDPVMPEIAEVQKAGKYTEGLKNGGENIGQGPDYEERLAEAKAAKEGSRETSDALSKLAAQTLSDPNATDREKSLAGSVLAQDETPGLRQPRTADMDAQAEAERSSRPNVGKLPPAGIRG